MTRPSTRPGQQGFTLIELMLFSVFSLVLSGMFLEVSLSASNTYQTVLGQGSLQLQLAAAADSLQHNAYLAASAPADSTGCGTGTGGYVRDLESNDADARATLILHVPSIDANGQIIAAYYDCMVYDFDATTGVLQQVVERNAVSSRTDSSHVVSRALTRVTFTLDNLVTARQLTMTAFGQWTEGLRSFDSNLTARSSFRNLS